jgi:hypothetical protein
MDRLPGIIYVLILAIRPNSGCGREIEAVRDIIIIINQFFILTC